MSRLLYQRLRGASDGGLLDTLRPDEARELADLLEQIANTILQTYFAEGDPISVIRAWLETMARPADPTDRDVIREAQHEEGRRIAEAVTTAGRLRDEFDFGAAHREVHVAIAEEIDRNRARADAELENGVVLALADWLAHRNELKGRDSDG